MFAQLGVNWNRKGKFGFLWLAATVGSHDRHLPKQEVLKINLAEACDQIVAGSTREPAEAEEEEEEEEESTEEEEPGKRKRKQKPARKPAAKKRRKGEEGEPERIVLGLRLSANLLLGVARVYDLQQGALSNDASQVFLGLRPALLEMAPPALGAKKGALGLEVEEAAAGAPGIDLTHENELGFGLDFGLGFGLPEVEWDELNLEAGPLESTVPSASAPTSRREEEGYGTDEEGEVGRERARRRATSLLASPAAGFELGIGGIYGPATLSPRISLRSELGMEFEPGAEIDLGLLGEETREEEGLAGVGVPSSPTGVVGTGDYGDVNLPEEYGYDWEHQPFPDVYGEFPVPEQPQIQELPEGEEMALSISTETGRQLKSALRPLGQRDGEPKKTVKLAKRDETLTYDEDAMREWRRTYVDKMIVQGYEAKEKRERKAAEERVHNLLFGVPAVLGFQIHEMVDFVLEQQNRKRAIKEPAEREGRKRRAATVEEGAAGPAPAPGHEDIPLELYEDYEMPLSLEDRLVRPPPEQGEAAPYQEYEIPIRDEELESELGRGARPSSRPSSAAPWDIYTARRARESSAGLPGDIGPPSSTFAGRPSTTGRPSFVSETVPRRRERSVSVVSSFGRRAPSELAYGEELIQPEEMYEEGGVIQQYTLDRAGYNFLEYLKKLISDLPIPSPAIGEEGEEPQPQQPKIQLSTVIPTESCSASAAAKGFYQILVLATKDIVSVSQTEGFGEIEVSLK